MKLIDKKACLEWCSDREIKSFGITQICFARNQGTKVVIPLPKEFLKCVSLMLALEAIFEESTSNSLLWIRDWDMWSEKTDGIGIAYWKHFRPDAGRELLLEFPGHLFSTGDGESLRALLLLPIVFQWDAQWFSNSGESIISIKHDGLLEISIRGDRAEKITAELEAWVNV
jgi:hypothetical protein